MDEEALSQQLLLEDSEPPPASWKHILAVTIFASPCVIGGAVYLQETTLAKVLPSLWQALYVASPAIIAGLVIGAMLKARILHVIFLQERMLEDMDRDCIDGGPWSAKDAYAVQYSMMRAPLRIEPPEFITEPRKLESYSHPDVKQWLEDPENRDLLESATPYERDALAWCASEGTPAGIGEAHGGVSLFTHVARVWKQNAQSFGVGSDAALLSVSHDLGKALAYRRNGDDWVRRSNRHERISMMIAMHLPGFLALSEEQRHRLMGQMSQYTQRKRAIAPAAARAAIQATVRSDAGETRKESPVENKVVMLPVPEREDADPGYDPTDESGEKTPGGGACVIPLMVGMREEGEENPEDYAEETEKTRLDDQEICESLPTAIAALNVNAKKRASQQAQGIYCQEDGFFIKVFDLVDQLQKMGLALSVSHPERTKSPWEVQGARSMLMAMSRNGWIITSPGRFRSEQGNDGVFNLRSGSKKYPGMVSINPDLLSESYLESIGQWCFDLDPV